VLTSPLTSHTASPLTSSQLRISGSPGSRGAAVAPLDPYAAGYTRDPYAAGCAAQPLPPLAWPEHEPEPEHEHEHEPES